MQLTVKNKPTVVFALANSESDHLPLLKEESSIVDKWLSPLHDKGLIEVYRDESTTTKELASIINRFNERIRIFHYAGHAGGDKLLLEQGDAHAGGLAALFKLIAKDLVLIFLNGCSTLGQVNRLMDLGIKAVIATSVPIADGKAVAFSNSFYEALSSHKTLEEAFNFAAAALSMEHNEVEQPGIIEFRSIVLEEEDHSEELPWGLYVNEDAGEVLNWKLPHNVFTAL